jgi:outer membrane protein assembly factor BamD
MPKPTIAFLLALSCAASVAGLGCAGEERQAQSPLEYAENARRDYETAMQAFDSQNWEAVGELMGEVRRKYGYSRYARLAELRLADANYLQEKYAEAISGYKRFVNDYPNDPEVPYARYRIVKGQYESVSQSVLLPPLEERDLASVNDAHGTIRAYLRDYPASEHAPELEYMLEVVVGLLARHELYVARFYLAEGRFDAAVARTEFALRNFKNSGLEPEAMLLLAEIRMKQKQHAQAREILKELLARYPDSAFSVPAKNFLAVLGEPIRQIRQAEN